MATTYILSSSKTFSKYTKADWKEYSRLLKDQLTLTQHDLKLANQDLEKYADEYAGLVAKKDEEIEELKEKLSCDGDCVRFDILDDYIFGRLKDICREEDLPYPEFCPVKITNELASAIKLKKEVEDLKEYADAHDVATCDYEYIREEGEKLKKEVEELKETFCDYEYLKENHFTEKQLDGLQSEAYTKGFAAGKPETNFDDANYAFYWAAGDGDVVFWKVPCDLMDLEAEEGGSRVVEAFQGCRFGEEWGSLSSHTIRTMTLEILEENE